MKRTVKEDHKDGSSAERSRLSYQAQHLTQSENPGFNDIYQELVLAITSKEPNIEALSKLIKENSIDCMNYRFALYSDPSDNVSMLHFVASKGNIGILKLLLDKHGVREVPHSNGCTTIEFAANEGNIECLQYILKEGNVLYIDPTTIEGSKKILSALCLAANKGHTEVVELLLKNGADANKVNETTGNLPLNLAASKGHTEVVELLLKNGADANKANRFGDTPLNLAASKGHTEIAELLLKKGAYANKANRLGDTPLAVAAMEGHTEVAELLLKNGADANKANETTGDTPLTLAGITGHTEVVKLLLKKGADANKANRLDDTPLAIAACYAKQYVTGHNNKMKAEGKDERPLPTDEQYAGVVKCLLNSWQIDTSTWLTPIVPQANNMCSNNNQGYKAQSPVGLVKPMSTQNIDNKQIITMIKQHKAATYIMEGFVQKENLIIAKPEDIRTAVSEPEFLAELIANYIIAQGNIKYSIPASNPHMVLNSSSLERLVSHLNLRKLQIVGTGLNQSNSNSAAERDFDEFTRIVQSKLHEMHENYELDIYTLERQILNLITSQTDQEENKDNFTKLSDGWKGQKLSEKGCAEAIKILELNDNIVGTSQVLQSFYGNAVRYGSKAANDSSKAINTAILKSTLSKQALWEQFVEVYHRIKYNMPKDVIDKYDTYIKEMTAKQFDPMVQLLEEQNDAKCLLQEQLEAVQAENQKLKINNELNIQKHNQLTKMLGTLGLILKKNLPDNDSRDTEIIDNLLDKLQEISIPQNEDLPSMEQQDNIDQTGLIGNISIVPT